MECSTADEGTVSVDISCITFFNGESYGFQGNGATVIQKISMRERILFAGRVVRKIRKLFDPGLPGGPFYGGHFPASTGHSLSPQPFSFQPHFQSLHVLYSSPISHVTPAKTGGAIA